MQYVNEYESQGHDFFAADAAASERGAFLRRTYAHLLLAVLGFAGLVALFLNTPAILMPMLNLMGQAWWAVLIAFMVVGWLADKWANSETSVAMQYLGLTLYTVVEAIIFLPILFIASKFGGPDVIPTAGLLTVLLFGGMTAIVMVTGADFSFLRAGLMFAGLAAMGVIVASMIFGFSLGLFFSAAMVVLMCGYILYYTSNVLHHYRTDQHVAAALALFAALATLFWYVIRIVMELQSRD